MKAPLLTLPTELHFAIISQLDIEDIIALDLTCCSLHILLTRAGPILRDLAADIIPSFRDALRVTRAKLLPLLLHQKLFHFDLSTKTYTELPKSSFFENLSASPPTLPEIAKSYRIFQVAMKREPKHLACYPGLRETYFRTAFRYLLFGVVYSQAFLYPLRLVEDKAKARKHWQGMRRWREKEMKRYPPFHTDDKEWHTEMMENLYSEFGKWLAEDARKRAMMAEDDTFKVGVIGGRSRSFTAEERAVLTEIMLVYSIASDDRPEVLNHTRRQLPENMMKPIIRLYRNGGHTLQLCFISSTSLSTEPQNQTRALASKSEHSGPPCPANCRESEPARKAHRKVVSSDFDKDMIRVTLKQNLGMTLHSEPQDNYLEWLDEDFLRLGMRKPEMVNHIVNMSSSVKYESWLGKLSRKAMHAVGH